MSSKTYEEAMIETHIYLSDRVDVHTLRSIIGAKIAESPYDSNVWVSDYLKVELEYPLDGQMLVKRDEWSSEGPYLETVACRARVRVLAWDSAAKTAQVNALLPLMWLSPYLEHIEALYRWSDPFNMRINEGFDVLDLLLYLDSAEQLAV